MQLQLLIVLQSLSNPVLDAISELFSLFGEIAPPMLFVLIIYWNISKKKGFALLGALLSTMLAANVLKTLVRCQRPFQLFPDKINPGRIETATGYSFPSGHTTLASVFYPSLYSLFRKKELKAAAAVLIAGICLARLYLGVHWPLDVIGGLTLGLAMALLLPSIFTALWDDEKGFVRFAICWGSVLTALAVLLVVELDAGVIETLAWNDLSIALSITGSALLGFGSERRVVGFVPDKGSLGLKTARTLLGALSALLVIWLLSLSPLPAATRTFFMLSVTVFWEVFLYPWLGVKLRLFSDNA